MIVKIHPSNPARRYPPKTFCTCFNHSLSSISRSSVLKPSASAARKLSVRVISIPGRESALANVSSRSTHAMGTRSATWTVSVGFCILLVCTGKPCLSSDDADARLPGKDHRRQHIGSINMTVIDFVNAHPWWTLAYLVVIAGGLQGMRKK